MDDPILALLFDAVKSHPLLSLLFKQNQMPTQGKQHGVIAPYTPTGTPYAPVAATMETDSNDDTFHANLLGIAKRPEGLRYYLQGGVGKNEDEAVNSAEMGLEHKIMANPADSARTEQVRKMFLEDMDRAFEVLRKNPQYANKTIY